MMNILKTNIEFNSNTGELKGAKVVQSSRMISDLIQVFADKVAVRKLNQDQLVYKVQTYFPIEEGTEGGLFFGSTTVYPGKVGDEYFMTKGHFHKQKNRGEFYWCTTGKGILLLMDEFRKVWAEQMEPGSLHYIHGRIAHRVVNTGDVPLRFGACWPSDAGHNYEEITMNGFSARIVDKNGEPEIIITK
jgi:glucose-6-phosphate isomerase